MNNSRVEGFCEELSLLLESGMVLGDALEILAEEQEGSSAEARILDAVRSGSSLGNAMDTAFPSLAPWIVAVVHAAESAAVPQAGLSLISSYLKDYARWKSTLERSLSYPIVLLAAAFLVGIFIMRAILPTLSELMTLLGGAVPITTRIALHIGSVAGSSVAIVLWVGAVGITLWLWSGRWSSSEYTIRIPLVKRLVYLSEAWRFFSVNSILLSAGIPLHEALKGSAGVLNSTTLTSGAYHMAERVQGGTPVQRAIREMPWLPGRTSRVLAVAASAGTVSRGFENLAAWTETKRNATLQHWNTWLPVIILCVATILIGFLAHAVLIPGFMIDIGP
jgi:type II secretory pathway component PulF